jgi:chromosome segregation ATPase
MNTHTTKLLRARREELEDELKTTREGLRQLKVDHDQAETAARNETAQFRDLQETVSSLRDRPAASLAGLLAEQQTSRDTARSNMTRTLRALQAARNQIADGESELRQIDELLPPEAQQVTA